MSEKSALSLNKDQIVFIEMVTGTTNAQAAVDRLIEMMVQEDLPRSQLKKLIERCMANYPK